MLAPKSVARDTRTATSHAAAHATSHPGSHEDEPGRHWFVNRPKVYPAAVDGPYRRLKWAVLFVLLAIYYVTPWIRWDRGPGLPDQAVLIDMAGRRGYFFFIEIWPQEVYYLTGLLIMAAFVLFAATALFGRIWCGYACWQTVWSDLFMWVERRIEGDRAARIRLDKAPLSLDKAIRKIAKHVAWIIIGVLTGGAWIFYFDDAPTLLGQMIHGELPWRVAAFFGLFSFTCYFFAGWAREQVCIYVCPWRSFQSAMVDEDSFLVTYQEWRGENRHPARKSQSWEDRQAEGYGDCVDCKHCVNVCPTGTDIRKGQQISCIGCGLCIDACDATMEHLGRPKGLVLFDAQSNQVAKASGGMAVIHLMRPRLIVYAAIVLTVATVMATVLATRPNAYVNVLRDRAPLYVVRADASVQNAYTVKLLNKTGSARAFTVSVEGLAGPELSAVGIDGQGSALTLPAAADTVTTYRVFVRVPATRVRPGSTDVRVVAKDTAGDETATHETVFIAP